MKRYLNYSLAYAVAAMAGGVFYREFTKWNGYAGVTALGKVHAHLFLLGMVVFLLVALFAERKNLADQKMFKAFMCIYNVEVPLSAVMMLIRGILQVQGIALSSGANAAISGVSGMGHMMTGIGLVLLLLSLRRAAKD